MHCIVALYGVPLLSSQQETNCLSCRSTALQGGTTARCRSWARKTTLLSRVPKAHTKDELSELLKAAAMGRDKRTAAAAQSTGASAGGDHGGSGELDETNQQAEQLATMAKDFLAARKDKAQEKALKRQLGAHLAMCYPVSQPCAAAVTQCVLPCQSTPTHLTLPALMRLADWPLLCVVLCAAADGTWEPLLSSLAAQVDSSPPFGTRSLLSVLAFSEAGGSI